ncbi:MAG: hypothetical protein ACI9UK_000060 [Candidatus Krumholzibacteriia bacterium]|jgi:hypothetical protein
MSVASGLSIRFSVLLFVMFMTHEPSDAGLVINEFLPDPAGTDGGREFVELLNSGSVPVNLALVKLEFSNGATEVDWLVRWAGIDAELPPGARFLLVDRNWQGAENADAEIYLGLQNGPDAIRLVDGAVVLDMVGYGALTDELMFEGQAVPVQSGRSLARRPDGHDTDNNASDFVASIPTPGLANFQPYSVSIEEVTWDPPHLARPGDFLQLTVALRNDGVENLPGQTCRVVWSGGEVNSWCDNTAPDVGRRLSYVLRPSLRGEIGFQWEYVVAETGDTLRYDLGRVQVGAAALRLNEVLPIPGQGQGEWVELQWLGTEPLSLAGYQLRDEDSTWRPLPDVVLRPGEIAVVVEDSVSFAVWLAANEAAGSVACGALGHDFIVMGMSGWPSLNNTPPASRLHADRIFLANPEGVVLDAVSWGGHEHEQPGRDLSLARIGAEAVNSAAANWTLSTAQSGSTPGCLNSVAVQLGDLVGEDSLVVVPPIIDHQAGTSSCHFLFDLAALESSWRLKIFNLWGDEVRDFGGDARGPGPRDLLWNSKDDSGHQVPKGAYVVWLEVRGSEGAIKRRGKTRVVVR